MALVKTEDLVRSRKTCNILGNAEKQRLHCPQPLYVTYRAYITTCIMSMHSVLTIHFVIFFVDSIKRYMDDSMVSGKYTAMMMMMFPLMMMMMDAFSFS